MAVPRHHVTGSIHEIKKKFSKFKDCEKNTSVSHMKPRLGVHMQDFCCSSPKGARRSREVASGNEPWTLGLVAIPAENEGKY